LVVDVEVEIATTNRKPGGKEGPNVAVVVGIPENVLDLQPPPTEG
jgi:uncharacterized protein YcnI